MQPRSLNFAPPAGTNLTVVKNTGLGFINGTFSNLAQGQIVTLSYGGVNYPFVASYYGGTGNDLVLQWANVRPVAWGQNTYGQLGDNSVTNRLLPVNVLTTGALSGKTVIAVAAGNVHSLALCSDGTLAAWGYNGSGQLGNNGTTNSSVPVAVNKAGVLAGKTVVAMAVGGSHSLALCSDGTLAAWGYNTSGQLGNNSTANSIVPVAVNKASGVSALFGKTIVAVAAGGAHSLALCSDGTVAAWGYNTNGQLGNNTVCDSSVAVAVNMAGVLAGKTVIAVAAGCYHSLALCSDGTVAAWGYNYHGELGDGTALTTNPYGKLAPVAVNATGVLTGKTVVAVTAGYYHSLVLCTDGTLAAWGDNTYGQLGNNSTTQSNVPVPVNTSGVLVGKTVVAVTAGQYHSNALCSDGTRAAWGSNAYGQMGNNSTTSSVPVAVSGSPLTAGERQATVVSGSGASYNAGLIASPEYPGVLPLTITSLLSTGVTLNGTVNPNGNATTAYFEYGLTAGYGSTSSVALSPANGTTAQNVSASLTGLVPATLYHYCLTATNNIGVASTSDGTFTTMSTNADLASLVVSGSTLSPVFASGTMSYTASAVGTSVTNVTPTVADSTATVQVNGAMVASGNASGPVSVASGSAVFTIVVTAQDGTTTKTYTVTAAKVPMTWTYSTASEAPAAGSIFTADGAATFALNFAPPAGTNLMVVKNTGATFINGTFSNLAQGQAVLLSYGGIKYRFVANYYGGTGNDLVLQWANVRPVAWGYNTYGQIGDNTTTNGLVPVNVLTSGVLSGKTVIAQAAGYQHTLALCSDGTVAAWGYNYEGELGDGTTTTTSPFSKLVPVAVNTAGVLAGKKVVAVAGYNHSLALCSDGTVAAWGYNLLGQLGNITTDNSSLPVAVSTSGVLAGKTVVAVAAGIYHSLALCSDGTLAAWGDNINGQLGNNSSNSSNVPVAVSMSGVLAGKTVIAVAAGANRNLVLCSDGTLATWGGDSSVPVAVTMSGVLAGKTVVAVAAGASHRLALCSDGTVTAWGANDRGQLGNNSNVNSTVPVAVSLSGVLAGKTVVAVAAGIQHSLALCSDGTMAAWGDNIYHQLGNDAFNGSLVPVVVSSSPLAAGERYAATFGGPATYHSLGLIASPPTPPVVITLAFTNLTISGVTLNGTVNPGGNAATPSIEYGTGLSYGGTASVALSPNTGTTAQNVSASLTSLAPETLYHYRLAATNIDGTVSTGDGTFTTHLSPLENWRQQWFGNSANSGPGTDDADPNGNGIPNLLEYALGGDPLGSATDGGLLPQAATGAANTLQIAFTRYLDRNDLTLTVKAADSLLGPWADLAQSAQGGAFVILQPGATAPETGAGNTRTVTVTDIYQVSDLAHPRRFIKLEVAR